MRLRSLDEIPGQWRSLRQAARFTQVVTGLVVLANLASMLLTDGPARDVRWVWMLNYTAVIASFSALSGGFWAEKRRQRETPEEAATFG